eukprot:scaffold331769_cov32-Prasinocladus_malaysianus.AAC.1
MALRIVRGVPRSAYLTDVEGVGAVLELLLTHLVQHGSGGPDQLSDPLACDCTDGEDALLRDPCGPTIVIHISAFTHVTSLKRPSINRMKKAKHKQDECILSKPPQVKMYQQLSEN